MTQTNAAAPPGTHQSVLSVLWHAPRPVWVLVLGVFVNRCGSFFSMFVVLFLTDQGYTTAELPPVLIGVAAASMVGSLAGGWLADRLGRKASLITSMTSSGLSLAALSITPAGWQTVLAVCSVALFTQSYIPAASALIVDQCAPRDRVPIFALFRLALNVGAAVGPVLAGLLAASSYGVLFAVDSGTCLLFAVLLAAGLPRSGRGARRSATKTTTTTTTEQVHGGAVAGVRANDSATGVIVLCLALFLVALVYAQYSSTLPLRLVADDMSPRFYANLLAFNAVLVITLELPMSGLTRRLKPRVPLTAGALLISLGMGLSGVLDGVGPILAAVAMWSVGEVLLAPVANAAVAGLSPHDKVGRYQGLLATAQALGFSLGPALGTYALAAHPTLPWIGSVAMGLVAPVVINVVYAAQARAQRPVPRHAADRTLRALPRRPGPRHRTVTPSTLTTTWSALDAHLIRNRRRPRHAGRSHDPHRPRRVHEPARLASALADPGAG